MTEMTNTTHGPNNQPIQLNFPAKSRFHEKCNNSEKNMIMSVAMPFKYDGSMSLKNRAYPPPMSLFGLLWRFEQKANAKLENVTSSRECFQENLALGRPLIKRLQVTRRVRC